MMMMITMMKMIMPRRIIMIVMMILVVTRMICKHSYIKAKMMKMLKCVFVASNIGKVQMKMNIFTEH